MTLSFWRYTHLALAVFSSLFLIFAALTGIILGVDAIQEKIPAYQVQNLETISLAEALPVLQKNYTEITELRIDHRQFVTLQGIDNDGNDVNAYIDPQTGKILGKPQKKSDFIQWTTALHRSLFLHEAGRFFVGFISFLLVIISISGLALLLKRQKSWRYFFNKIVKDYLAQYYHVFLGRIALVPLVLIALTGVYLTLEKTALFESFEPNESNTPTTATFDLKKISLAQVKKIEFPFSDDEEDYFIFELKDRKIEVNQYTNKISNEVLFPITTAIQTLSLDIHTGRTNVLWALVLILTCFGLLYFIYSGFAMTFKRRENRIKNKYSADESTFILLVGSENGSTFRFAIAIQKQLIAQGHKAFISELNAYQVYPKAEHLLVFAATYGLGEATHNASKFSGMLSKIGQKNNVNFTVIGFGSYAYPDFCGFARQLDALLEKQPWASRLLELQTVNDKSAVAFVNWVRLWSDKTQIALATTPSLYNQPPKGLQKMMVLDKTTITSTDPTFILTMRPNERTKFQSGDLLAIYPNNDNIERLYSIGKHNGNIQLSVKLHPEGLGSGLLYHLNPGELLKARIISNENFHLPKKTPQVAFISNGTGIAPFLGMIEENKTKTEIYLYSGFRMETETTKHYQKFATEMMQKKHLKSFQIAYSREQNHCYVMDLIEQDANFFINLLMHEGIIMICGSLTMQQDVEKVLNKFCLANTGTTLEHHKQKGQILTDCY
ncbi:PepSY domain-containing protein [Flavobacterium sp. UMI-01]|uniref:PepSY domain-containing protein n=1 Tax=Flavobacterium sp. UMI-01 TaxID=1441053 RepID=UPI001C7DABE3|nr:PepSY domain-containing protein [Flavobacterium sp. UMI-01]GIZ07624.1 hypothetical protein FUMI01_03510 [Flavobacterium sp. UMI-01]